VIKRNDGVFFIPYGEEAHPDRWEYGVVGTVDSESALVQFGVGIGWLVCPLDTLRVINGKGGGS
jgi:hypothetical protein